MRSETQVLAFDVSQSQNSQEQPPRGYCVPPPTPSPPPQLPRWRSTSGPRTGGHNSSTHKTNTTFCGWWPFLLIFPGLTAMALEVSGLALVPMPHSIFVYIGSWASLPAIVDSSPQPSLRTQNLKQHLSQHHLFQWTLFLAISLPVNSLLATSLLLCLILRCTTSQGPHQAVSQLLKAMRLVRQKKFALPPVYIDNLVRPLGGRSGTCSRWFWWDDTLWTGRFIIPRALTNMYCQLINNILSSQPHRYHPLSSASPVQWMKHCSEGFPPTWSTLIIAMPIWVWSPNNNTQSHPVLQCKNCKFLGKFPSGKKKFLGVDSDL